MLEEHNKQGNPPPPLEQRAKPTLHLELLAGFYLEGAADDVTKNCFECGDQ